MKKVIPNRKDVDKPAKTDVFADIQKPNREGD